MRKLDFLIGGAAKAGTTSLAKLLNQVQDVYCHGGGNELQYFGKDRFFRKGLDWYNSHFADRTETYLGEKSTTYLLHPEAAQRIKDYRPDIKLVFMLRNPADRAYSQYKACIEKGTEYLSFERAIATEANRRKLGGFFANNYAYQIRGYYYDQLKRYYDLFPESQMRVLIFEEFKKDPQAALQDLCAFLDIPYQLRPQLEEKAAHANKTRVPRTILVTIPFTVYRKYVRPVTGKVKVVDNPVMWLEQQFYKDARYEKMSPDIRQQLIDQYQESNQKLADLLGKDLSIWNR